MSARGPSVPWWALAAGSVVLAGAGLLAWALYDSLFPIFLGFGLAYAFDPLADRLERAGLGRTTAVVCIMGGFVAALAVAAGLLLPPLLEDAGAFARSFPDYAGTALNRAIVWAEGHGLRVPHGREEAVARLKAGLQGVSLSALSPVGRFAARFFSGAAGTMVGVLNLLVIPVVFFYFLRDISAIRGAVLAQVPPRWRAAAEARLDEADTVFSGYLRGQMSVALILAAVYSVGLTVVGVPFGAVIGVAAGLLNVVPYVGVLTGLLLSVTMCLVDFTGWGTLAGALGVFAAAQVLEGFFITPRIVGDKVGLGPVETLIALILGGEVAGMLGLVLAIPVAGCAKAYWNDLLEVYRASPLFESGAEPGLSRGTRG